MVAMKIVPISRSCQGCAATDLLDIDDSILSLRGGFGLRESGSIESSLGGDIFRL